MKALVPLVLALLVGGCNGDVTLVLGIDASVAPVDAGAEVADGGGGGADGSTAGAAGGSDAGGSGGAEGGVAAGDALVDVPTATDASGEGEGQ